MFDTIQEVADSHVVMFINEVHEHYDYSNVENFRLFGVT